MILGGIVPSTTNSAWEKLGNLDIECIADFIINFKEIVAVNISEKLKEKSRLLESMVVAPGEIFLSLKHPKDKSVLYHYVVAEYLDIPQGVPPIYQIPYWQALGNELHKEFSCKFLDVDIFLYCPLLFKMFIQENYDYKTTRRLVDDYYRKIRNRKNGYFCTRQLTYELERVVNIMRSGQ